MSRMRLRTVSEYLQEAESREAGIDDPDVQEALSKLRCAISMLARQVGENCDDEEEMPF